MDAASIKYSSASFSEQSILCAGPIEGTFAFSYDGQYHMPNQ